MGRVKSNPKFQIPITKHKSKSKLQITITKQKPSTKFQLPNINQAPSDKSQSPNVKFQSKKNKATIKFLKIFLLPFVFFPFV
jgi:hypothetical protein